MKKIYLLVILLLTVSLATFAQGGDAPADDPDKKNVPADDPSNDPTDDSDDTYDASWRTLENEHFAIKYPSNWSLDQSGLMGSTFFLFAEVENAQDQFRENVNLIVQDLTGYNMDLDQYTALSEQQIRTMFQGAKILLSERKQGDILEYQKIIYTATQSGMRLKFEQYYWVDGNTAAVLTLTTEEHTFDKYQEVGEKILNSFTF